MLHIAFAHTAKSRFKQIRAAAQLVVLLILTLAGHAQTSKQWTWESGSDSINQQGSYGTKGTASSSNMPGSRSDAVSWVDGSGNFWLFGGSGSDGSGNQGYLNDLWKWDGSNWTWVSGSSSVNQQGIYGTKGTASSTNEPGSRRDAISLVDASGNFWLFGGSGSDGSGNQGYLNDLWKWDGSDWTWVSGSNTRNQQGSYGTKGIASSTNVPGARQRPVSWFDASGNFWLFGGGGYNGSGNYGYLNDLWKWDGSDWTWVSGSGTTWRFGSYGIKGTASSTNEPGSRRDAKSWVDGSGNFWLFSGHGIDGSGNSGELNDLWKWDGNNWTWISGSSGTNQQGNYGTKGTAASTNVPGARNRAISWVGASGNFWLFGGDGYDGSGNNGVLNDIWKWDGSEWTWISGPDTRNQQGSYVTKGTASFTNVPGARRDAISWVDSSGNFWLFGGYGMDGSGNSGGLNDLWSFGEVDSEIQIKGGNAIEIADGDSKPSVLDGTKFGSATVGAYVDKTYTIKNLGTDNLGLDGSPKVQISGTNADQFSVTSQPSAASIAPNSSFTFTVRFQPSSLGEKTAQISISNNDPNESTYTFSIKGMAVVAASLNLGQPQQIGSNMLGSAATDRTGESLSLSSDGQTVALGEQHYDNNSGYNGGTNGGRVCVFNYSGSSWSQRGSIPAGTAPGENVGKSVSISGDGLRLVYSAPGKVYGSPSSNDNRGQVVITKWNGSIWSSEEIIWGTNNTIDDFGSCVAISRNGNVVAIGSPYIGSSSNAGNVQLYQWNGSTWVQMGSAINGEANGDQSGMAVALSADGSIVAIGAPYNDANSASNAGHVRVYEWDEVNTQWVQIGNDIDGSAAGDENGYAVALSDDGQTIVMGAPKYDGAGSDRGQARVFRWSGSAWVQQGAAIVGSINGRELAQAVDISSDGKVVCIGYTESKQALCYKRSGSNWVQAVQLTGSQNGDATGFAVALSHDATTIALGSPEFDDNSNSDAGKVSVFDIRFESEIQIEGSNNTEIAYGSQTSTLSNGTYFDGASISASIAKSFTIENTGKASLVLTSNPKVAISGTNSGDFAVSAQPSTTIASSGSTTFSITFTPSALGERNAIVTIDNNDADESSYTFAISGTGIVSSTSDLSTPTSLTTINGASSGDYSGYSSALSNDGSIIAIGSYGHSSNDGHVRVYKNNSGSWSQMGSDIDGVSSSAEKSGTSVAISANGEILAVGAPANNSTAGKVYFYEWNSGSSSWDAIGSLSGSSGSEFGTSVALSRDGNTVAIGSPEAGSDQGEVKVYLRSGSTWNLIGGAIQGQADYHSGYSVDLSDNGKIVAVGSHGANSLAGQVVVYEWDGDAWQALGSAINGASNDWLGRQVALSADGTVLAISAVWSGSGTGHVEVHQWQSATGNWSQIGSDIVGTNNFGTDISLSADGQVLAASTAYYNSSQGYVNIYRNTSGSWVKQGASLAGSGTNIEFGRSVSLSATGRYLSIGAHLYNSNKGYTQVLNLSGYSDILLKSGTTSISSGSTAITYKAGTHLGGVPVNGSTTKTFAIHNEDSRTLNLLGNPLVSISGTNASSFSVSAQPVTTSVSGFSSTNFTIGFQPTNTGLHEALVTIVSDDDEDDTYTFKIAGYGVVASSNTLASNVQQGSDIDGTATSDEFGSSVAFSADGTTLAVGAPKHNSSRGEVIIYTLNGSSRITKGNAIEGSNSGENSGVSVALSADGNTLAIGAPYHSSNKGIVRLFEWDAVNSQWDAIGSVEGENNSDLNGSHIALSSDGSKVAMASRFYNTSYGNARIFERNGSTSTWNQVGNNIVGQSGEYSGILSLAGNGSVIAIGSPGASSGAGLVRVYEWSGSSWVQIGSAISGETSGDWFGQNLTLSKGGDVLAIGAPKNSSNSKTEGGEIEVYGWNGTAWSQLGNDISPETQYDYLGWDLELSHDGTIIVAGAYGNDGSQSGYDYGHVRVFKYASNTWTQIGNDIDGEAAGDESGSAVAISADGSMVAIGAIKNSSSKGHVRVYNMEGPAEIAVFGNGVEVADNDNTPDKKDHTHFGPVDANFSTKSATFSIKNTGADNLTLSGSPLVAVSGTHSSDFSITQPGSSTIAPGSEVTFSVSFDPDATGLREATLTIANSDADEGTYNFDISGLGSNRSNFPFEWVWQNGSSNVDAYGSYGIKGTASSANVPGGRHPAMSWTDSEGNFYLFGGAGYGASGSSGRLNDLWKWDGSSWTWLSGSNATNAAGVYSGSALTPGARAQAMGFVDASDNLWLFGGYGKDGSSNDGFLNDLWKWDGSSWSFEGGSSTHGSNGIYGTTGTASPSNWPGARYGGQLWLDNSGTLWLYGGDFVDVNSAFGTSQELWKWSNGQWTLVGGQKTRNQKGSYGTKGTASGSNWPAAKKNAAVWIADNGNLWMFGGYGYDASSSTSGSVELLNDLFTYNTSTGFWTWISGDHESGEQANNGVLGKVDANNHPGARAQATSWKDKDGNLLLYGGQGLTTTSTSGYLNDLWKYDPGTNKWIWVGGSKDINQSGEYGSLTNSSSDNSPGARNLAASWLDSDGDIWMFGGEGYNGSGSSGKLNDLWQLDLTYVWQGSNTTWGTNSNWKNAGVPSSGTNYKVKIPASASNFPTLASDIEIGTIEIEDGGELTIPSGKTLTINKKFTYSGSTALDMGNGKLKFNGTEEQELNGKVNAHLEIDNANNVKLGADAIAKSVTLTDGHIELGDYDLTLAASSTGSSSSYIKVNGMGKVKATVGASPITIPIGRNPYEPIIIDDGGSAEYSVGLSENVYENPENETSLMSTLVVGETWTIQASSAQTGVSVTLQWNESEEETSFDRANCVVGYWEEGVSTVWNSQGTNTSATGSNPYSLSRTIDFSTNMYYLGVGSVGSPLPVELTYFEATWLEQGKSAQLNWQTAMEENNSHFEIERSIDGQAWENISQVAGQGSKLGSTEYTYTDQLETRNQKLETIYYRLKQVDYNGAFDFSEVRTLNVEQATLNTYSIYPNPVNTGLLYTSKVGDYEVMSITGKTLFTVQSSKEIRLELLSPGIYFLKNQTGAIERFIVE